MDWIKPNGSKITTNDLKATSEYCESLGWEKAYAMRKASQETTKEAGQEVKRRGRPKKVD